MAEERKISLSLFAALMLAVIVGIPISSVAGKLERIADAQEAQLVQCIKKAKGP